MFGQFTHGFTAILPSLVCAVWERIWEPICAELLSASIGGPGRAPSASAGEIRTSQDFPRPGAGQLIGPIVPRVVTGAMMGAQPRLVSSGGCWVGM